MNQENKLCYIMGDFNFDVLKCDTYPPASNFINCMSSHGFRPLITKPTRVTPHTYSCIDYIFSNVIDKNVQSGIFLSNLSDHFPIFKLTELKFKPQLYFPYRKRRNFSLQNILAFKNDLNSTDWTSVTNIQNPNLAYNSFAHILHNLYVKNLPMEKKKHPRFVFISVSNCG